MAIKTLKKAETPPGYLLPVALSAYFLEGEVRERNLNDIFGGMIQFMGIQLIGMILIIFFSQIAL